MIYSAEDKEGGKWRVFEGEKPLGFVFSANDETGELVEYVPRLGGLVVEAREIKKTTRVCDWKIVHKDTGETIASWPPVSP